MARVRRGRAAAAALPLAALAVLAPAASAAPAAGAATDGTAAPTLTRTSGPLAELRVGRAPAQPTAVLDRAVRPALATATFRVTYVNFPAAAKAAFQRAVTMWSKNVTSSVPITVRAEYKPLGPGVLGSAGSNFYWRDVPGLPRRDTWYPDPVANRLAGRQLHSSPDIIANFSSSFSNWHFGSGRAPAGTYDFTSVVAHEIGHGLGFAGFGRLVSSSAGSIRLTDGVLNAPSVYDRFTEDRAGRLLDTLADPSAALKTAMTNGALFFDSPAVRSAHGGRPAKLYAPGTFRPGSSYSHLDEATYRPGTAHSLMTPQLGSGETVRTPGAVSTALLRTLGW